MLGQKIYGKFLKTSFCKKAFSNKPFPNNAFDHKGFPYSFNQNYNNFNKQNSNKLQTIIKHLFPTMDINDGIELAYTNYIEAIADSDVNFLQDICERTMGDSIENVLTEFEGSKYECVVNELNNAPFQLNFTKISYCVGVSHIRQSNKQFTFNKLPISPFEDLVLAVPQNMNSVFSNITSSLNDPRKILNETGMNLAMLQMECSVMSARQ